MSLNSLTKLQLFIVKQRRKEIDKWLDEVEEAIINEDQASYREFIAKCAQSTLNLLTDLDS